MTRSRSLAIAGLCGVLFLGACSSGDEPVTDAAPVTSQPLETTATTAAPTTTTAAPTTTTAAPTTTTSRPATTTTLRPTTTVSAPPATRPAAAVTVKQFQFMPAELVVQPGARVTWTNQDDILHTATSGATPGTPDGKFDGTMDGAGKSYTFTFDQTGRYPYYCSRHPSMTGTVVVQ